MIRTWIQVESADGVEAICTMGSFVAANELGLDAMGELDVLLPGSAARVRIGGGAAPDFTVEALSEAQAKALDEIEECVQGGIEIEVRDGIDEESGAMPFAILFDGQIIGADTTLDRTIADALETARGWAGERAANAESRG